MGIVINFPTEYARKRASLTLTEPAKVFVLPLLRIPQLIYRREPEPRPPEKEPQCAT